MSSRPESSRGAGRTAEFSQSYLVPIAVIVAVLMPLSAFPVMAENRFVNPEFDGDTKGWNDNSEGGFPLWDFQDHDGCEGSGSVLVSGETPAPIETFLAQCIPVVGGEILRLDIEARPIFALGPVGGSIEMTFSDSFCVSPTASLAGPSFDLPLGAWTRFATVFVVPSGYNSAFVKFVLRSPAIFDALFDFAYAGGQYPPIFNDGFEYESTCRW